MVDGPVAAKGTAAEIIGRRTVTEVRSGHWPQAFSVLESAGFLVQLQGAALRVNGAAAEVAASLSRGGVSAEVATAAANLEEAFVKVSV